MNTKLVLALAALSYAPLAVARNEAAYPKEKVAAFVVEENGFDFAAVRVPGEEGERKEDTCGLRFHGADGRARRDFYLNMNGTQSAFCVKTSY
jgi:hypothetical protein